MLSPMPARLHALISGYRHRMRHYDVIVIGTGSGNSVIDDAFVAMDVGIVEHGEFGGTCVNVGCIPTKMFAYTADVADTVRAAAGFDLDATLTGVGWPEIQNRVLGRVDGIAADGRRFRIEDCDNVTVHLGHARFSGPRTLRVERTDGSGFDDISADRIVVAAGGRPVVPEPVASSGVPYETSDTVMGLPAVPPRLAVLGGSYIAVEFAHIFAALGSQVVVIDKAEQLLGPQDETIAERFTAVARQRYDVRTGREIAEVASVGDTVRITLDDGAVIEADTLLVAVGRVPNGDRLDLEKAGIDAHDDGRIVVDAQQRTTADGVFALGGRRAGRATDLVPRCHRGRQRPFPEPRCARSAPAAPESVPAARTATAAPAPNRCRRRLPGACARDGLRAPR